MLHSTVRPEFACVKSVKCRHLRGVSSHPCLQLCSMEVQLLQLMNCPLGNNRIAALLFTFW